FSLEEREPSSGASGDGAMFVSPPQGMAGPDGRIRLCDLHSGVYRLTAFEISNNGPSFFGENEVPVGDKDVHAVKVVGRPRVSVSGELVWDGKIPDQPAAAKVRIMLQPMTRAPFRGELASTNYLPPSPVPGQFTIPGLLADDYSVTVMNIPAGAYLKDIIYGGRSALHEPMRVGKTMGSDLRIVLAQDGGVMNVKVADKDSNPVPDCRIVLLPENASTEAEVADSLLQGQTDQNGGYSSGSIAPGKYYVLATNGSIDRTPETIAKLMQMRTHMQEADLQPNGSMQLTLVPIEISSPGN
ncbi:MAG: carboxypeptidase-like regulatory domain-containing protein, partial [Acidobacteriota bacterium]|nr:carboxypeptidase-like regulatory domain-containing protein [Acidobacteriota bacterium]